MAPYISSVADFVNGSGPMPRHMPPHFVRNVIDALPFSGSKWTVKEKSLAVLQGIAEENPDEVSQYLPEIVPIVSDCMVDLRQSVKVAAANTLSKCCLSIGNKDIEPFVPILIASISDNNQVAECIHQLSATTFVQTVDARTLAVLVPLLCRGIVDRTTVVRRKTCVIINNMAKLVDDPADAYDFSNKLIDGVKNAMESMSNPEARAIATKCYDYLFNLHKNECVKITIEDIRGVLADKSIKGTYVSGIVDSLLRNKVTDVGTWETALGNFTAEATIPELFEAFKSDDKDVAIKETEPGEDLCDCEFSLAYGGKILLNSTRLNIKRGNRYGLIGPNGAGKSTLMRAIANGQLDGFPDAHEVCTVYVEHDIDSSVSELSAHDFVASDPKVVARSSPERILEKLIAAGFDETMRSSPISSLSGGWKMKLALTRAILLDADVILMDEVS